MLEKIVIIFISSLLITSCAKENMCQDVDLGVVLSLDKTSDYLDFDNVDTLVYINQDSVLFYLPLIESRTDVYDRVTQYRCIADGNFYTANYQIQSQSTVVRMDYEKMYFSFTEQAELPIKASLEIEGLNVRKEILDKIANQTKISVYNIGYTTRLAIFTESNNNELSLDVINQVENEEFKFYDSTELNGKTYFNVYYNIQDDNEITEIFYSKEMGVIRFTDKMNNVLTLASIIFK